MSERRFVTTHRYLVIEAGPSDVSQASGTSVSVYRFADRADADRFARRGADHALASAKDWGGYPAKWFVLDLTDGLQFADVAEEEAFWDEVDA